MKTKSQFVLLSLLFFSAINSWQSIFAQGNLNPTGPPAPMFRTLEEVQPRRPIGTNATPGDTNALFVIAQPGSYFLTTNLTGVAGKHGIMIAASGVTLDLMGFEMVGVTNALDGITVSLIVSNLVIRNGTVRNWRNGIDTGPPAGNVFAVFIQYWDLRLSDNGLSGLHSGRFATVINCTASANNYGIWVYDGALSGCSASLNRQHGFQINYGASLIGCVANGNGEAGIWAGNNCTISHCTTTGNQTTGIYAGNRCTVTSCTSVDNLTGIYAGLGTTVNGCTAGGNSFWGASIGSDCHVINSTFDGNGNMGILVNSDRNRIDNNSVNGNGNGIKVINTGNLIIRNSASGNTTNYVIAAGNKVGPIVAAPDSGAISGSTGGAGVGTTDPWANISY